MSQFEYTPLAADVGGFPTDWTLRKLSGVDYTFAVADLGSGQYAIHVTGGGSGAASGWWWSGASGPGSVADVEFYARLRFLDGAAFTRFRQSVRWGVGTAGTVPFNTRYAMQEEVAATNALTAKRQSYAATTGAATTDVALSYSPIASAVGVDIHALVKCVGDQISYKIWRDGDSEPAYTTVTDTDITAAGVVGFSAGHVADAYLLFCGAGTGGDSAPRASLAADTTAPVLTSPVGTQTGSTTATVGATTDEGNGTMYAVVTVSGTAPSVAQIQAGQDNSGSAAAYSGSQSISSTGAKTFSATGLAASTSYYAHVQHKDAAGNDSTVVTSAQFTTASGASALAKIIQLLGA